MNRQGLESRKLNPSRFLSNGCRVILLRVYNVRGVKLNSYLHLASRLIMNGVVPLLLSYAFMAFEKTTLLSSHLCLSWRIFMILHSPWQCFRLLNVPLKLLSNFPLRKLLRCINICMYLFISEEIINVWKWIHKGKMSTKCCQYSTWMNRKYVIHRTEIRGYICMYVCTTYVRMYVCIYECMNECWRLANLVHDNWNGKLASKWRFLLFYFSIVLN
jgi:hypothetical protein